MSSPRKLPQYKGLLTPAQVAQGMNAAHRDAVRLHADAAVMLGAKRYPTAFALAALSIEEIGKLQILRRVACCTTEKQVEKHWREYRTHTAKSRGWVILELVREDMQKGKTSFKLEDFRHLFADKSVHTDLLDQLKQLAFYTDCLHDQVWLEPSSYIKPELAENMVRVARERLGTDKEVTAKEIELWRDHVRRSQLRRRPDCLVCRHAARRPCTRRAEHDGSVRQARCPD